MGSLADRIMRRVRGHGRGRWVCTPKDFLDLGSRAAVDRALARLVRTGRLRRVGRGLYDLPRYSAILGRSEPPDLGAAVKAIARRDNIRIMPDGCSAANWLGLSEGIPARAAYATDGRTRRIGVGRRTVHLSRATATVMNWHGRPGGPVIQALHWLGPGEARHPRTAAILRRNLPDCVKRDLLEGRDAVPAWMAAIVDSIAGAPGPGRPAT